MPTMQNSSSRHQTHIQMQSNTNQPHNPGFVVQPGLGGGSTIAVEGRYGAAGGGAGS